MKRIIFLLLFSITTTYFVVGFRKSGSGKPYVSIIPDETSASSAVVNEEPAPLICWNDQNTIWVGIGCGVAGSTSDELDEFRKLDSLRDYQSIKQKMIDGTAIEKVLAAVAVNEYLANNFTTLTPLEQNEFSMIKRSRKRIDVCSGCLVMGGPERLSSFFKKQIVFPENYSDYSRIVYRILQDSTEAWTKHFQ